jgi:soluble calcium-activated nucleotidase 1
MWHESAAWSDKHQRWFFLPRKVSHERYETVAVRLDFFMALTFPQPSLAPTLLQDESRGSNLLISADDSFQRITVTRVGQLDPVKGYSSFKFVPGTEDSVVRRHRRGNWIAPLSFSLR